MLQKLLLNNFKCVEETSQFNDNFITNYNEESDEGYFLEVDVQYTEKIYELHNDLQFFYKRKKLKKVKKLVTNLHDKNEYVIYIRNLKKALNYELILKKVHRLIKFNQKDQLKPYIAMNTELSQKAKNSFKKDFFNLMKNSVFGKTMENERKSRDIKLVTTERRRKYLVLELNYRTINFFYKKCISNRNKKTQI